MSSGYSGLKPGTFNVTAHERIVFGTPAGEAVVAEAERSAPSACSSPRRARWRRRRTGPLQRIEQRAGRAPRRHLRRHQVAQPARGRGGGRQRGARGQGRPAGGGRRRLGDRRHQGDAAVPVAGPRQPRGHGALLRRLRPHQDAPQLRAARRSHPHGGGLDHAVGLRVHRERRHHPVGDQHQAVVPAPPVRAAPVVLDPAATLDTPDWLLFCTGIRSVDHAVENYCNAQREPGDRGAVAAGPAAAGARAAGHQAEPARSRVRGWRRSSACGRRSPPSASGVPTGASHGIGYALGATFGVAHGHTSCVMLPAVLKWNAAVNGERQKALSEAMGAPGRPASELVRELVAGLDQPVTLRAVGIKRENLRRDRPARARLPAGQAQPAPDQDGEPTSWRSWSWRGDATAPHPRGCPVRAASLDLYGDQTNWLWWRGRSRTG